MTNKISLLSYDRLIKSWIKWSYLFSIGLSEEDAIKATETDYYHYVRKIFIQPKLKKDSFISSLLEKHFTEEYANELYKLASTKDIAIFNQFVDAIESARGVKSSNIEYYLRRGWNQTEARAKLKSFYLSGPQSIENKRKASSQYDLEFRKSRLPGANAAFKTFGSSHTSKFELELKNRITKEGWTNKVFYSPILDPLIQKKKNFIHDFYINDELIVEYNGTYWHKDAFTQPERFTQDQYYFELRKAYNCIKLVKREHQKKYLILWEADIKNDLDKAIYYIKRALEDNTRFFFSTREIDENMFDTIDRQITKEYNQRKLFMDICERFAQESHCLSKKVCALAVKDNRIICTGINGTSSGLENCDDYFRQYHKDNNIQIPFDDWIKTKEWRELHHAWSLKNELHGEASLITEAARRGIRLKDCDIYVNLSPCNECSKLLFALKPKNIFYKTQYDKGDDMSLMFKLFDINYKQIKDIP